MINYCGNSAQSHEEKILHTCSHLLVRCKDFRLHQSIHEWLESHRLVGQTDEISQAGSVLQIVEGGNDSGIIRDIAHSIEAHRITNIMLMNHAECGAYLEHRFGCEQDETAFHYRQMCEAVRVLRSIFGHKHIYTLLYGYKDASGHCGFKIQQLYMYT